jgi:uncharacterized tellurite resistance protein B-like protein
MATEAPLDMSKIDGDERVGFYGALFAMAATDGSVDKDEMQIIYELMILDGMTREQKATVHSYVLQPPPLRECLRAMDRSDRPLRYGLLVNLVDVAYADDDYTPGERDFVEEAARELSISQQQLEAVEEFVRKAREVKNRGLDDRVAEDILKTAAAGLSSVGVPITAVYFSGTVVGLSAAGITSGLAALGLGFGMIPGVGVAILLGTAVYVAITRFLDVGGRRKKEILRKEAERRAQVVIANMQESLNHLVEQVARLSASAAESAANREAIAQLTARLRSLQQLLNRRKNELAARAR